MSRKLYVIMRGRPDGPAACGHKFDCLYYVWEHPDGRLLWLRCDDTSLFFHRDAPIVGVFPRSNYYDGEEVADVEAELITGLTVPVAYDRLRELVHES